MTKNLPHKPEEVRALERLKLLEHKTKTVRYLQQLFEDQEFIDETELFKVFLCDHYPTRKLSLGYDLEFLNQIGELQSDDHLKRFRDLAKKYHISTQTLCRYMNGEFSNADSVFNLIYHQVQDDRGQIVLRMSPHITETQYRALWNLIELKKQQMGVKVRKRNRSLPNNNDKLIYCIEKAVDKGVNIEDIFTLYNDSKLPGYPHSDKDTPFSLASSKSTTK